MRIYQNVVGGKSHSHTPPSHTNTHTHTLPPPTQENHKNYLSWKLFCLTWISPHQERSITPQKYICSVLSFITLITTWYIMLNYCYSPIILAIYNNMKWEFVLTEVMWWLLSFWQQVLSWLTLCCYVTPSNIVDKT